MMILTRWIALVLLLSGTPVALALNGGTDLLVPAAARGAGSAGSTWITDLYVLNPGDLTVSVEIFWLERNRANPSPPSEVFGIAPGETLVLEDVVLETFGFASAGGALRVVGDAEVVVSSRIYNQQGTVSFGQGFEGVPRSAAIHAGGTTDIMGLSQSSSFRTNIVLVDASDTQDGSRVELSLRDRLGFEIASRAYDLARLEPKLLSATNLGTPSFENATLHVEVTRGAAIVAASKVDSDPATGDPTTLEAWTSLGPAATVDGIYQLSLVDSYDFAGGGRLVVADGAVTTITATYFNWDKTDAAGNPECRQLFYVSETFDTPVSIDELAQGLTIERSYDAGELRYTLTLTVAENLTISGTIDAVGSNFPLISTGCNGTFPALVISGGKSE
jgi:hypothetical protein